MLLPSSRDVLQFLEVRKSLGVNETFSVDVPSSTSSVFLYQLQKLITQNREIMTALCKQYSTFITDYHVL